MLPGAKKAPPPLTGYGVELILDLYGCDPSTFNRLSIDDYFTKLLKLIDLEKCVVHFWDDLGLPPAKCQTMPKTKGTSAVCFLVESNVTIHTLDLLGEVYVNIFSCKSFTPEPADQFTRQWFRAKSADSKFIVRGARSISDPNEPPDPARCGA